MDSTNSAINKGKTPIKKSIWQKINYCIVADYYFVAKYHYLILIGLLFVMLLAACGGSSSSSDSLPGSSDPKTPPSTPQDPLPNMPGINGELAAGINQITITQMISGINVDRQVFIKTPQNFDSTKSYPVIFVFHGAGGSANQFANNQDISNLIDTEQFIGVFPQGHSNNGGNGGFWNLGVEPTDADDLAFVDSIIQSLGNYKGLDNTTRYAIGFSNGAGMVNLLGKSTSYFRAIAPLFSQQTVTIGAINSNNPISVFQLNGETDGLIPLNGGTSSVGVFLSAEASALNWVNVSNCSNTPVTTQLTWGSIAVESKGYSSCSGNHEVKFLVALATGHGFQDSQAQTKAYEEVLAFFYRH